MSFSCTENVNATVAPNSGRAMWHVPSLASNLGKPCAIPDPQLANNDVELAASVPRPATVIEFAHVKAVPSVTSESISSPPWMIFKPFKPLLTCSEPLHPACDGHGARKPISASCMKKLDFAIWNHCESLRSNGVQSGARMYCSWMEWRLSTCCGSVRDPNSSFHKSQTCSNLSPTSMSADGLKCCSCSFECCQSTTDTTVVLSNHWPSHFLASRALKHPSSRLSDWAKKQFGLVKLAAIV